MCGNIRPAVSSIKQGLCNSLGLPFPELLEMRELDGLAKGGHLKFYDRIYTPLVTLLAFIAQVLDSKRWGQVFHYRIALCEEANFFDTSFPMMLF